MDMLPEESLIRTGAVDQGDWNYHGLLGRVVGHRARMVAHLLTDRHDGRLLEVGYGSGVFMPLLGRHCTELHGIDVHPHAAEVAEVLTRYGLSAQLRTGTVEALPYSDASMATVVCISVLEFVEDLETACTELRRVLAPGGTLVVVTPGHSRLADLGLRLLTGHRAEDTFQGRRQRILPTLTGRFRVTRRVDYPVRVPGFARLYTGVALT
jgi:2-polyprenyl-3-methyl-5-hydroxy-6-metoxy-1,4-benzoquinol methylase